MCNCGLPIQENVMRLVLNLLLCGTNICQDQESEIQDHKSVNIAIIQGKDDESQVAVKIGVGKEVAV